MAERQFEPAVDAAARLRVDLAVLADNWRALDALSPPATETGAVVKSNAYGHGLTRAGQAFAEAGCSTFFVATLSEGVSLRSALPAATIPAATIYVLDGLLPGAASLHAVHDLRPALSSPEDIDAWAAARRSGVTTGAALHVDTGMNRLGLRVDQAHAMLGAQSLADDLGLTLLMSHLACADEPDHPTNRLQLQVFHDLRRRVPDLPASLANSAGVLSDPAYHHDLMRPGIALYGAAARQDRVQPTHPAANFEARILQLREAKAGETVGYGAKQTLTRDSRIAVVGAGYADGYPRQAGAADGQPGAIAWVGGRRAPLLGRVSMDLIAIDVTDVPEAAHGDWVELFGIHITVDDVADRAGTIGYEILTGIGQRVDRVYESVTA